MKLLPIEIYNSKRQLRSAAKFPTLDSNSLSTNTASSVIDSSAIDSSAIDSSAIDSSAIASSTNTGSAISSSAIANAYPETASLVSRCPTPYDQGTLGSCTANAIAAAIDLVKTDKSFKPSRLFIYQNESLVEHSKLVDHGADDMDGLVYISKKGVCSETTWPYNTKKFKVKPPKMAYNEAKKHICSGIISIPKDANFINNIKAQIAKGYPVLVGLTLFNSVEVPAVAKTGIISMPLASEKVIGGHEMLAVAYDSTTITCLNSWGQDWGDKGFAHFPIAYVDKYFDEANLITGFQNSARRKNSHKL
jgi:C1A family cysteine protease